MSWCCGKRFSLLDIFPLNEVSLKIFPYSVSRNRPIMGGFIFPMQLLHLKSKQIIHLSKINSKIRIHVTFSPRSISFSPKEVNFSPIEQFSRAFRLKVFHSCLINIFRFTISLVSFRLLFTKADVKWRLECDTYKITFSTTLVESFSLLNVWLGMFFFWSTKLFNFGRYLAR